MKHTLISLAILSTFSVPLLAAEATEEKRNWDASAELGFNLTSGNTDTSTLKARIDAKHNMTSWENTYVLDILRKDDDG
ncbi:MAG: putative salt-induced outer membrane protein, partial [Phenylobacterium sp.]